jgi:ArsR family transcriptional regulator
MPTKTMQGCCGLIDPGMSDDDAVVVAERFRALADPTRVRIMNLLIRNRELCVCDVNANFDLSQPTISHHLGLLRKAGLVTSDVRGRWAFYRVNEQAIEALADVLEVTR